MKIKFLVLIINKICYTKYIIGDSMKKNGFTLVEILTVIIILGVMIVLFVPNTINIIKQNNAKIYKVKEKDLIRAAEDYANYDSNFDPPTVSSPVKYITMFQLSSGNYLDKILDTSSGNECVAFVKVTTNSINGYNYDACIICDEYKSNKDFCNASVYQSMQ